MFIKFFKNKMTAEVRDVSMGGTYSLLHRRCNVKGLGDAKVPHRGSPRNSMLEFAL